MSFAYSAIELLSWYSTKLLFRDINIVNLENLPEKGPTLLYGNHNNQFVDGMLMMAAVKRPISFIAAAKSCKRTFVGPLISATGAIPVERPQDAAFKGQGKICRIKDQILIGEGTEFSKIVVGSTLLVKEQQLRVNEIINEFELKTDSKCLDEDFGEGLPFKIIPKLDFNQMYEAVWSALRNNECVGIFPEGGSHDRMELLPLKAGICIMALGAMDKYNTPVKIVPCGFNYYNPHKFRSKVIMEFGPAYQIPQELLELYRKDKKKAISILLLNLENMLKEVTTEFKSFDELSTLFLCRQLYTMNSKKSLNIKETLELNRRFAKGYQHLINNRDFQETYRELMKFNEFVKLNNLPLRKENYFSNVFIDIIRFIFYFEKCLVRTVIALPGLVMMGPTTTLITYLAEKERIKCLKGSKVKRFGNDVISSYKVLLSIFMFPFTAGVHSSLLYYLLNKFTQLSSKTKVKISLGMFLLQPIYALLFVKSYDSFAKSWKKLKYFFMRIFKRDIYQRYNDEKKELSRRIHKMVDKYGEEVIENFQQNRIIGKSSLIHSESQLYIFDEEVAQEDDI